MSTKKYKLLKDLPNVDAGAILELTKNSTAYRCKDKYGFEATFSIKMVESHPEWFEIKEDVKLTEVEFSYYNGRYVYQISSNLPLDKATFHTIKSMIETISNQNK